MSRAAENARRPADETSLADFSRRDDTGPETGRDLPALAWLPDRAWWGGAVDRPSLARFASQAQREPRARTVDYADIELPAGWLVDPLGYETYDKALVESRRSSSSKMVHRPRYWGPEVRPACLQGDRNSQTEWVLKEADSLGPAWRDECSHEECQGYTGWGDE